MAFRQFTTIPDDTKCDHVLVGPELVIEDKRVGHCDKCNREVALQLNTKGERTGKSWLIMYQDY
jgi:hypothetical protein